MNCIQACIWDFDRHHSSVKAPIASLNQQGAVRDALVISMTESTQLQTMHAHAEGLEGHGPSIYSIILNSEVAGSVALREKCKGETHLCARMQLSPCRIQVRE